MTQETILRPIFLHKHNLNSFSLIRDLCPMLTNLIIGDLWNILFISSCKDRWELIHKWLNFKNKLVTPRLTRVYHYKGIPGNPFFFQAHHARCIKNNLHMHTRSRKPHLARLTNKIDSLKLNET